MPTEREIKLRFHSADTAREQILALGATPLLGRRLQEDCLFDTEDERLRRERSTLRVRSEGGKALLTWKGPVIEGVVKIREEYETVVADGAALQTILEELGLHIWFRYEKYREEFTLDDCIIAIDETPVGVFVEIEGGDIAAARLLGREPCDFVLDSYRALFVRHCETLGVEPTDMLFADLHGDD